MSWAVVAGLLWLTLIFALLLWGVADLVDDWRATDRQFREEED